MSTLTRTIALGLAATDFLDFKGSEMTPIQFASSYADWLKGNDSAAEPKAEFVELDHNAIAGRVSQKAEFLQRAIEQRPQNALSSMLESKSERLVRPTPGKHM